MGTQDHFSARSEFIMKAVNLPFEDYLIDTNDEEVI